MKPKVVAFSNDGKDVLTNIFMLSDTYGLPLSISLGIMKDKGQIPSWMHFIDDAFKAGWSVKKVMVELRTNITDIYGKDFWNEVYLKIDHIMRKAGKEDKYFMDLVAEGQTMTFREKYKIEIKNNKVVFK